MSLWRNSPRVLSIIEPVANPLRFGCEIFVTTSTSRCGQPRGRVLRRYADTPTRRYDPLFGCGLRRELNRTLRRAVSLWRNFPTCSLNH